MGQELSVSIDIRKRFSQILNVNTTGLGGAKLTFYDGNRPGNTEDPIDLNQVPLLDFIFPLAENNTIHNEEGFIIFNIGAGLTSIVYNVGWPQWFRITAQNGDVILDGNADYLGGVNVDIFFIDVDNNGTDLKVGQTITIKKLVYKHFDSISYQLGQADGGGGEQ